MDSPIKAGDSQHERLLRRWLEERRPGYLVVGGGVMYQVIAENDDNVIFIPVRTESFYGSTSGLEK